MAPPRWEGTQWYPQIQEGPITHKYQFILPDKALDDLNIFKYTAFISVWETKAEMKSVVWYIDLRLG